MSPPTPSVRRAPPELVQRAAELGVVVRYADVDQNMHDADPDVLERVVEILEADRAASRRHVVAGVHVVDAAARSFTVDVEGAVDDASLVVEGVRTALEPGGSGGIPIPQLPVGCHTMVVESGAHVEECTIVVPPPTMPGLAAGHAWSSLFVPAYALWERHDQMPSYGHLRDVAAVIGRLGIDMLSTLPLYATFLDEPFDPSPYSPISRLHWNEAYIADDALPSAIVPALGDAVDWRQVGARRRSQLVEAAAAADQPLIERLHRFVAAHPHVGAYARFMTDRDPRDPVGGEIVERSHVLAQMLCDEQIAAIGSVPGSAGLSIDLPVGSHPSGYEVWAHPGLFAPGTAVGAPPDTFFVDGQNWGFPPQLPGQMRHTGYALWRQMIEHAGRHAAMLRIDHVMAVHRLWWVPDGDSADRGVYVRYPERELLAIIAASAAVAGVAVVGENLGTVPPEVVAALDDVEMLGMYEEQFTTGEPRLADIPARSVAGVRTHDMTAFAEHAATADLSGYVRNLEASRSRPVDDLFDSVLERLTTSDAAMVVADLDDLLDERRPHNLPGRVLPGIWQRRLDRPASEVFADDKVRHRLSILNRKAS